MEEIHVKRLGNVYIYNNNAWLSIDKIVEVIEKIRNIFNFSIVLSTTNQEEEKYWSERLRNND